MIKLSTVQFILFENVLPTTLKSTIFIKNNIHFYCNSKNSNTIDLIMSTNTYINHRIYNSLYYSYKTIIIQLRPSIHFKIFIFVISRYHTNSK